VAELPRRRGGWDLRHGDAKAQPQRQGRGQGPDGKQQRARRGRRWALPDWLKHRKSNDRIIHKYRKIPLTLPPEPLTARELCAKLSLKMTEVIPRLVQMGLKGLTPDDKVDLDYAELIGLELGRRVVREKPKEVVDEWKRRSVCASVRVCVVCVCLGVAMLRNHRRVSPSWWSMRGW
jgi:hypothetical protein